jgi:hypothetical protein
VPYHLAAFGVVDELADLVRGSNASVDLGEDPIAGPGSSKHRVREHGAQTRRKLQCRPGS